ncbi:MAG: hypothetical protein M1158_04375 [Candidatus Marsarchaeota archaeon]|jgi:hypothetical protein|nr:hypothetical protein [Candidatus Marsarchaeota archaeon]
MDACPRAQASFEFMLYTAASVLALAAVLPLASHAYGPVAKAYSGMDYGQLAAAINSNMQYSSSNFTAYVPGGLCGGHATMLASSLGGSLELDAPVEFSARVCASSGLAELSMAYAYNGTYVLDAG